MAANRAGEGHENRVPRAPLVHGFQLASPPLEQFEAAAAVADFVTQIVGPAAIGVDVVKIPVQSFGQQKTYDVEILVVVGGQPAGIRLGIFQRPSFAKRFRRIYELGWRKEHERRL